MTIKERKKSENMFVEKVTNGYNDERAVVVYRIHEFLTTDEISRSKATLKPIIDKYKLATNGRYELKETPMFGDDNLSVCIPSDYKITNSRSIKNELEAYNSSEFDFRNYQKELRDAFTQIIIRMIETICQIKQVSGKLTFRVCLKSFVGANKTWETELKNPLGWHYDFFGKTTMALELANDISECGTLEFSSNCHGKPIFGSGKKTEAKEHTYRGNNPFNNLTAQPLEESIISVNYPKNGAILFDGYRGHQIHRPIGNITDHNVSKTYCRAVLQVVLTDDEWTK